MGYKCLWFVLAAVYVCLQILWHGLGRKVTCGFSISSTVSGITCCNGFVTAFILEATAAYGIPLTLWMHLKKGRVLPEGQHLAWHIFHGCSAICSS